MQNTPFRQIRALHDDEFVRVYQAYSDDIADKAVQANSFEAPRAAGIWSAERMTWIKPSAVWMAYRCGWSTMKDKKQARVLALDLSRARFEEMMMGARLAHGGESGKGTCKDAPVVVQWDPEREMFHEAEAKQVLTRGLTDVRSIQIGLRGPSVAMLLDPTFVLRITDVTEDFREAASKLAANDKTAAAAALWRHGAERPMEVPAPLRAVLGMDVEAPPAAEVTGRVADAADADVSTTEASAIAAAPTSEAVAAGGKQQLPAGCATLLREAKQN